MGKEKYDKIVERCADPYCELFEEVNKVSMRRESPASAILGW